MSPVLLEVAVTVRVWLSFVAPVVMPERFTVCWLAFWLMLRFDSAFSVGAWFTELTVTVNVRVTMLLLAPPSFTVTVTVANANGTGVKAMLPVVFGLV